MTPVELNDEIVYDLHPSTGVLAHMMDRRSALAGMPCRLEDPFLGSTSLLPPKGRPVLPREASHCA